MEDKIPDNLHKDLLPRHWELKFYTNLTNPNFQEGEAKLTTHFSSENATVLNDSEIPDDSEGIRPGSLLLVGEAGCTSNFIWQDENGTYYLGLAGHCTDGTYDTVYVCIEDCKYGSKTQKTLCTSNPLQGVPGPEPGGEIDGMDLEDPPLPDECVDTWGNFTTLPVAHDIYEVHDQDRQEEYLDFGIAEIPEDKEGLIVPRMKVWGGPVSELEECPQDVVGGTEDLSDPIRYASNYEPQVPPPLVLYGHAGVVAEAWPTKARAGFFKECAQHPWDTSEDDGYSAWLPSSLGDSGGSVNLANVTAGGVLEGREAFGLVTRFDTHHGGVSEGLLVSQGKRIAQDEWGLNITVVPEGATIN